MLHERLTLDTVENEADVPGRIFGVEEDTFSRARSSSISDSSLAYSTGRLYDSVGMVMVNVES